jgi:murein DD-endopeptidase MepM/ murein hydrolase activator NlpD
MKNKLFTALITLLICFSIFSPVQAQDQTTYPYYVVADGDSLNSIANRFDVSVTDLINLNNITNPDFVSVGTQLIIPGLMGLTGQVTTSPVQLGESLKDLTVKYQIDKALLQKLNQVVSPDQIYAGSSLILPVVEESKAKVPVSKVSSDETTLEMAAKNNTSVWDVLYQNGYKNESEILPGEMIYLNVADNSAQVSPVDTRLTSVTISPLPLVQGKTFKITVESPKHVTLTGSLNGSNLNFFSLDDNKQIALQGIYAMADPGLAPFTLSGTFDDGSTFNFEQSVLLIDGGYPTDDPLTVDPALIDPKVTGPEDDQVKAITSVVTPTRYWSGMWQLPAVYNEYTATFGDRRTYNDGAYSSFHSGLDFAGGKGLPIYAPADGKVVFTGLLTVRGNATIIDHGWGVFSAYYHQSEIEVKVGDMVTKGQEIGQVGNTGRVNDANAFEGAGSHLHFEIWVNGIQVDPVEWLDTEYP